MDGFTNRAAGFVKRERIYIFLLIFVVLFHLSFLFFNQFLEDSGLGGIFEEGHFKGEDIISDEKIMEAAASDPVIYFIFLFLLAGFLLFVIIGIALDIVYLYLERKKKTPFGRTQPVETGLWGFWDICKIAIIFLFVQRVMWLTGIFLFAGISYLETGTSLGLMLSATLTNVIAIAAIFYFVLNKKKQAITSLGLTTKRFFVNIKYGVFAYIGLIPVLASVMFLTMWLFNVFNIPVEPQPILVILQREKHIPTLIYMGFFAAFFGPVLEEIFFRGFAYPVFRKRLGVSAGIVLSAAFFAYVHANLASFFPIFCLGMLLAHVYEKTGSLVSSITVHVIHNSVTFAFLIFIKIIIG